MRVRHARWGSFRTAGYDVGDRAGTDNSRVQARGFQTSGSRCWTPSGWRRNRPRAKLARAHTRESSLLNDKANVNENLAAAPVAITPADACQSAADGSPRSIAVGL